MSYTNGFEEYLHSIGMVETNVYRLQRAIAELHAALGHLDCEQLRALRTSGRYGQHLLTVVEGYGYLQGDGTRIHFDCKAEH